MRILTTQKMIDEIIEVRKKHGSLTEFNNKGFKKWIWDRNNSIHSKDESILMDYIVDNNNKISKHLEPALIRLFNYLEL